MDLVQFFCYITVMCDTPVSPAVNVQRSPNSIQNLTQPAIVTQRSPNANQNLPPVTDGRKSVRKAESYPTRYDYIDVEAVMSNERIIKVLFNCVMNQGPCTREGLELKRIIPDAIQTECAKCSERQRIQAGKALAYLLNFRPEYWNMLIKKFDPNNVHLRKYMADSDEDEKLTDQNLTNSSNAKKN